MMLADLIMAIEWTHKIICMNQMLESLKYVVNILHYISTVFEGSYLRTSYSK